MLFYISIGFIIYLITTRITKAFVKDVNRNIDKYDNDKPTKIVINQYTTEQHLHVTESQLERLKSKD
ncbi:hypothetical protein [Tenacibaculum sp. 190524A05c]|uniref:hypothetical protein n=1 Tax=Tenacibaculum platacis TaxID=3137852 RepID=UPI0031FABA4F